MGAFDWVMYYIDSVTVKCFDRMPVPVLHREREKMWWIWCLKLFVMVRIIIINILLQVYDKKIQFLGIKVRSVKQYCTHKSTIEELHIKKLKEIKPTKPFF